MLYRVLLIAQMLALASCASPVASDGAYQITPTAAITAGRVQAEACIAQERLAVVQPFTALRFWLDPTTALGGHGQGRDAYVQERLAGYAVLWAHEVVHLMTGLPGKTATDHPAVFWRCGLDPRQF